MHRSLLLLSAALLPACANEPEGPPTPAEPLTCEDVASRYFAIDELAVPRDADGDITGLDLDRDDDPDNAGGRLLSNVFDIYSDEDAEGAWNAQLAARFATELTWVVEITSCGDDGEAQVNLHQGVRDGDVVRLVDTEPADGEAPSRAATGHRAAGHVTAHRGIGVAPLGALADVLGGAAAAWHQGYGVAAELELGDTTIVGTLGFGFAPPYRMVIGESFLGWLNARLAAGESDYGPILDRDQDGTITYEELNADALFDLLMRPDLDALDFASDEFWPGHDGIPDSYSFGMSIHAAEITVE